MDSDGSATEFRAVQDEVVGIGADPFEVLLPVGIVPFEVLRFRSGERMVHCVEALGLIVPLKEREIDDPERGEDLRITKPEAVAHLDTEHAEHCLGLPLRSAEGENQVSGLCLDSFCNGLKLLLCVEFVD